MVYRATTTAEPSQILFAHRVIPRAIDATEVYYLNAQIVEDGMVSF